MKSKIPSLNHEASLVIERESGLSNEKLNEWEDRLRQDGASFSIGS